MKWTSMMVLLLIALLGNQPSLAQRPASFAGFVSNVYNGFSRAVFRTATVTVVTEVTATETYTATTTVTTTVNTEKSYPSAGFLVGLEIPSTTSTTTTEPSTTSTTTTEPSTTSTTTTEPSTTSTTTPAPTLDEPQVNGTSFIISTSFNGISSIKVPDTSSIKDDSSSKPLKSTASSNNKNIKPSVATFTPQLPKRTSSISSKKASSISLKTKTKSSTRFFTALRNSKELSDDESVSIVPFEVLTVETSVTATPIVPYFVKRSIDIESSIATGGHKHTGASPSVTDTTLFATV